MAKAKKQESAAEPAKKKSPAAAKKDAPKAAAKAAPAAKKSTAAAGGGGGGGAAKKGAKAGGKSHGGTPQVPLIDTGLAAQTAAAMVASGLTGGDAPAADAPANRPESSAFKNLKQGLNKPSAGSLGGILGTGSGSKKFSPGFGTHKQGGPASGGRNQTFGADVNRAGVPRRTGGG
jgi:hypothetical protein